MYICGGTNSLPKYITLTLHCAIPNSMTILVFIWLSTLQVRLGFVACLLLYCHTLCTQFVYLGPIVTISLVGRDHCLDTIPFKLIIHTHNATISMCKTPNSWRFTYMQYGANHKYFLMDHTLLGCPLLHLVLFIFNGSPYCPHLALT